MGRALAKPTAFRFNKRGVSSEAQPVGYGAIAAAMGGEAVIARNPPYPARARATREMMNRRRLQPPPALRIGPRPRPPIPTAANLCLRRPHCSQPQFDASLACVRVSRKSGQNRRETWRSRSRSKSPRPQQRKRRAGSPVPVHPQRAPVRLLRAGLPVPNRNSGLLISVRDARSPGGRCRSGARHACTVRRSLPPAIPCIRAAAGRPCGHSAAHKHRADGDA